MTAADMVKRLVDPRSGRLVREVREALAGRDEVPLRHQLVAWRHGFYAETTAMYDLERYGVDAYVSDYRRATTLAAMNENRYLLDDKLLTFLYLREFGLPTPTVHGFVQHGKVVWLGAAAPPGGLDGLLERRGKLAIKPRAGSGGTAFAVLTRDAGTAYVNGRPVPDLVQSLGRGPLLLCDYVEQHERPASVYPGSTNTIRVITFRDVDTDQPFIAAAIHRFGTDQSRPVDNFAAGGLSAGVDLATGTLRRAIARHRTGDGRRQGTWVDAHPDTGVRITGMQIPHWQAAQDGVLRAAEALPGSRYVGWDLAVTRDGFSIIEGNNRADVNFQVHGPLLLDERVRKVFAAQRRGHPAAPAPHGGVGSDRVPVPASAGAPGGIPGADGKGDEDVEGGEVLVPMPAAGASRAAGA